MIVYLADKTTFLHDNDLGRIDEVIQQRYHLVTGRTVPLSELRSWQASLGQLADVIRHDEVPVDTGVAVEFHIPQSSKRIDVTLTGRGAGGAKNAVIVELKQWEKARATKKDAVVETFLGRGNKEVVHPSYQAWSYAQLLEGFNRAVYDGGISVRPCAYLHNYERDGAIDSAHYAPYMAHAPLFLKGEPEKSRLRHFISRHIKSGDNAEILHELDSGEIRPSKALADGLLRLLHGNQEFVLIDEQKIVYEAALAAARASSAEKPRVVIVEGGPGTGKTVVAINLLVALTAQRLLCKYVSKNAAPRAVFETKLTGSKTATRFGALFGGSGSYTEMEPNSFDALIVDEAHRLNEKSGLFRNKGENQVKELISSAKCAIFFIDEDQRVTLEDIGSKELIREFAAENGASVEEYVLESQFRCSGSEGYIAWLDHVLGVRKTANSTLSPSEFDFRVFDSPVALHEAIDERNTSNKARVVAGYCWPWRSKKKPREFDIRIGADYKRRWNLDVQGPRWIIEDSVSEVGCIHTCQGLELEYVGVIIGPDLIVRNGRVVTVPEARAPQDRSLWGFKTWVRSDSQAARGAADIVIKNTYRTLMTRGMKGCFIYSIDEETRDYFRTVCVATPMTGEATS